MPVACECFLKLDGFWSQDTKRKMLIYIDLMANIAQEPGHTQVAHLLRTQDRSTPHDDVLVRSIISRFGPEESGVAAESPPPTPVAESNSHEFNQIVGLALELDLEQEEATEQQQQQEEEEEEAMEHMDAWEPTVSSACPIRTSNQLMPDNSGPPAPPLPVIERGYSTTEENRVCALLRKSSTALPRVARPRCWWAALM